MKNNCKNSFLTDIASISTGKWDANHATENGKYRFYTCAYDYLLCDTKRFQGECLVLPGNGVNVGEVFYYEGEFDAYQRTYVISDIKIFPKYLHYHMLLYWKALGVKKQYGSATNFIKIGNFKDYEVQFPPLAEQKRIVAILDEAFEAIAKAKENTKQNLKNAKEIFESYLQGVFENKGDDWEEKKLGEVCEIRSGRNQKEVEDPKGIYPILGSAGKIMGYANKFICEEGTTIIGRKGTIDKPIFIEEKFWNVDTAFGLHALKELDKRFLFYFCKSYDFTKQDKGSGRPSLVKSDLLKINIPLPPLAEQKKIVQELDALKTQTEALEQIYTQKLNALDELQKSLLQKAFAGELVK